MTVRALILTGFGINCDLETAHAFTLAGAIPERLHVNDLIGDPQLLEHFQIFAIPGGFSFGDDVASGKILANRLRFRLGEPLQQFLDAGKLAIGICNGFQVMVKMGMLPRLEGSAQQEVTLTHNDSSRYEDRWTSLRAEAESVCIWTKGAGRLELPVRHGEGKFIPHDAATLRLLCEAGQIALRYTLPDGSRAAGRYPYNPNASVDDVAGICDASGRVFGLMPHPEAFLHRTNHPRWTREELPEEGAGLQLFRNAVQYAEKHLL